MVIQIQGQSDEVSPIGRVICMNYFVTSKSKQKQQIVKMQYGVLEFVLQLFIGAVKNTIFGEKALGNKEISFC